MVFPAICIMFSKTKPFVYFEKCFLIQRNIEELCDLLSSAGSDWVDAVVESNGILCSRKGVNLPGCDLIGLQAVSERDEADLRFGVSQGIDIVFASFIRSAQDVKDVRRALGPHGRHIKVISKVESRQGVQKWVKRNTINKTITACLFWTV